MVKVCSVHVKISFSYVQLSGDMVKVSSVHVKMSFS